MDSKNIICTIVGTCLGAIGTSISVTEVQAIVSMVITILGFIISVLIPLIVKLVNKIKKAKEDGKISEEEVNDIISTGKEIVDETTDFVEGITKKGEKSDDKKQD